MTFRLRRWISGCAALWVANTGLAAAVVTAFSPVQGQPGTQVAITGSGFSTATQVQFDTVVADFVASSDSQMTAVVPLDAISGPIRVTNPGGTGVSGVIFRVAPRLTDFSPARSGTNMVVTLNGANLGTATNVSFNNQRAQFTPTSATQIQAIVPFGATNGPITVITPAGSAVTTNSFVVTGPAPIIDTFSPGIGAPGTVVQIIGANLTNVASVKFNGVASLNVSAPAQTQIIASVPPTATTGKITITTAGGSMTSSNNFVVTKAPVITNFFPSLGNAGTPVVIEGINFTTANITGIGFNGVSVGGWGITADNQINVTVPTGATTGPITITNTLGVGISVNDFVISRAPMIDFFFPDFGPPGTAVVINGANFTAPVTVKFNGVTDPTAAVTALTQIHTKVPANATSGSITVSNSFGGGASTIDFIVTGGGPQVTGFTPERGPRGTSVIISGVNFTGSPTVKFNGVVDPGATVTAPTQIHATVPASASTGPITVTTTSGTSTNANIFYLPPRLTSFTPTNGVVGSSVVITGANFVGVTDVLFNSAASSFVVGSTNRLTAVVPTNATTGPLTIRTPGGPIISSTSFRVVPNITDFSPIVGPAGTLVTIKGTSFLNATNVSFNNVSAVAPVVTSTQITAAVPAGATTGPIRVTTPDGVAVSATNFTVSAASDLRLDLTASAAVAEPGQPLAYTITVMNDGPAVVTGVVVTNELPAGVQFVSALSSLGVVSQAGGVVTCNLGVLTNAAEATITITVSAVAEGVWTDSAGVSSVENDLFPINNSWFVTTTVVSDQSRTLRVSLAPDPGSVTISWPTSAVPFFLQTEAGVDGSNTWSNVTNSVIVSGGRNSVTNAATGASRYYRLQKP